MFRDNSVYWNDKEQRAMQAVAHTKEMASKFADEIKDSSERTIIYESFPQRDEMQLGEPKISLFPEDSVTGIFNHADGKTCVLNFASYKEAGGMFLKGSKAQEECLCHESFLYNVLKEQTGYYKANNTNLNRGLYTNRALYSPDIMFMRDGKSIKADVLTCAAPNFYTANKYCNISSDENFNVLRSRIRFILSIMRTEGVKTAILGAYGCGVFCQDATEVAKIFAKEIPSIMGSCDFNAVFAVPKGRDRNYEKMESVFNNIRPDHDVGQGKVWSPIEKAEKVVVGKNIQERIPGF